MIKVLRQDLREGALSDIQNSCPIVGIGASAGGVEALGAFFEGLPINAGLGYVIVTHLSPDRESVLHEIIARMTALPVHVAADGAEVLANNVYVMPAGVILGYEGGRLRLRPLERGLREHKPVDVFLSALAAERDEWAAGVILSGGDSDGTLGIRAVKQHGGLTFAQVADGVPPRHPSMPDNAILSGMVDHPLPPQEMGQRLAEWSRSLPRDAGPRPERKLETDAAQRASRDDICALLHNQTGHDFSGYKVKTFTRRVERRMQVTRRKSMPSYIELLRQDPAEVSTLFRDLLINVTNFFRDAEAFEALKTQVIPKLFEGRGAGDAVRVWVPGCATGEEAYSIAMLMREHVHGLRNVPRIQIFATDIDDQVLTVARAARYPEALLEGVSDERRRRFFVEDAGSYCVTKEVRQMCIFSPHSVLRDPPFSRIDMISCRNLLIYFDTDVQSQVIPTLRYALRPGGYLFLGMSENISSSKELFVPVDKKHRIFRGRDDGTEPRLALSAWPSVRQPKGSSRSSQAGPSLRQTIENHVLERHAPPHVVVTAEGDVVFYSARTGKYLEPPAGAPNRQLMQMARKGMRLELRNALQEAAGTGLPVRRDDVEFEREDGRLQALSLAVDPLPGPSDDRLFLVTFNDVAASSTSEQAAARAGAAPDPTAELERELREARERLQSMIEEYETAIEELKSSNEELLSVNEEMQSTNEELEASKEELQSVNEELHTVNAELNVKVEALDQANNDLQNIFESSRIATVFLDKNFTIRLFTPAATSVFKILHSDVGRPISDLTSDLAYDDMTADLKAVLTSDKVIERQIKGKEKDVHYLVRVSAYVDSSRRAQGAVVTVTDVSRLANIEAQQRILIAELNHRVKNMLAVVLAIASQTRRSALSTETFYEALSGRLRSMGRSYELLSRESWTAVPLADIARKEFAPFDAQQFRIEGEPVALAPRQALSIGMILHELVTNAAKYGALSAEGGAVELVWSGAETPAARRVVLTWRETGGPPPTAPKDHGFGLQLLERETSYNLDGSSSFEFAETGLIVRLEFPIRRDPAA